MCEDTCVCGAVCAVGWCKCHANFARTFPRVDGRKCQMYLKVVYLYMWSMVRFSWKGGSVLKWKSRADLGFTCEGII